MATESYGVLYVLNTAALYLTNNTTMTEEEKTSFRSALYGYFNGDKFETVDKRVLNFLNQNNFLSPEEKAKLHIIKRDSQSQTQPSSNEDSEPEA